MDRLVLTALLVTVGAATTAALPVRQGPTEDRTGTAPIVSPKRISPEPPPITSPPTLPTGATALPPLTLIVETTRSGPAGTQRTTQTVTRGSDRVLVALHEARQEWLFLQNRVYPARVTGYLIDHDAREIRFHDESPLRSRLGIRGWVDVLTLRFDTSVLSTLRATGERRDAAGAAAVRFVADALRRDGIVEVWWSEALLLPLSVTTRGSGAEVRSVVERLTSGADPAPLADAADRFPTYKNVDAADAGDH